jgi:hypothetical protein
VEVLDALARLGLLVLMGVEGRMKRRESEKKFVKGSKGGGGGGG